MEAPASIAHNELYELCSQLVAILTAIEGYQHPVATPPILEIAEHAGSIDGPQHIEAVPGLRALKDAVRKDLDVICKFLDNPRNASLPPPSTNAPYLVAVWNEVRTAVPPIFGIRKTFTRTANETSKTRKQNGKTAQSAKVDVVAAGGKQWIRVNTTKNSRLLAELREIDSYCTDSEDESDQEDHSPRTTLAPAEFDNSVLRSGRDLLAVANANPLRGTANVPSVILRLTRLDPNSANPREQDIRIARTIDELRSMGINVHLGSAPSPPPFPAATITPRQLIPSLNINLDLSLLVALISDLTHSPPPTSPEDAQARFTPPAAYREWKAARIAAGKAKGPSPGAVQHARALAEQAIQEGQHGLLTEMHTRIEEALLGTAKTWDDVTFWTTQEGLNRCLRIVDKIGGPGEQRRARALFPSKNKETQNELEESFWLGSRYQPGYLPILPIRVIKKDEQSGDVLANAWVGTFFHLLRRTSEELLVDAPDPHPLVARVPERSHVYPKINEPYQDNFAPKLDFQNDDGDGELTRATVTRANPRLTAHTVQSMRLGAERGWTTLTANKTSVRAMLREIRARHGAEEATTSAIVEGEDAIRREVAALWTVEPRSLAEGMRSDCEVLIGSP